MNQIIINNFKSKLLSLIYGVILFGPHRLFGFNYIQEVLILILFILYLYSKKISNEFKLIFLIVNIFYLIKLIQMHSNGMYDYLIYLSIPLVFIKIGASLFLINEKYTRVKDLIIMPLILSFLNSFLIIIQFFKPNLRFITTKHSMEISYELSNRFLGIAHDGFQITTFITCSFLIYLIIYNKSIIKILNLKNENLYSFCVVLLILILPFSWLFQGRLSQLISILSLVVCLLCFRLNEHSEKLEFSIFLTNFQKKIIFQTSLIASLFLIIIKDNFRKIINSKPIQHALEIYTKLQDPSSIASLNAIMKDKNLFDYFQNFKEWLIGKSYSGRGNFLNIQNVDFDNGYFLSVFKFGILGSAIVYLTTFIPLLPLFKHSKISLLLLIIFLLTNIKEQVYLSGASYLSLFFIAKLEILSKSKSLL